MPDCRIRRLRPAFHLPGHPSWHPAGLPIGPIRSHPGALRVGPHQGLGGRRRRRATGISSRDCDTNVRRCVGHRKCELQPTRIMKGDSKGQSSLAASGINFNELCSSLTVGVR